jgi:DNA-binding NtrC family response regulator
MATRILVVDDDVHLGRALHELLTQAGFETTVAHSAEEALDRLREQTFHLVLTDLQLPGRNGISLIKTISEACPETKCVLITAHGSTRTAVTALKRGAVEYVQKPIKPRRLLAMVAAFAQDAPAYLTNRLLAGERREATTFDGMHARSASMRDLFERVKAVAAATTPVLILGESGTGKSLVARSIHQRSSQSAGLFVSVSATEASAMSKEQLEELDGGTLFIDEVSGLDERGQERLLKLLSDERRASTPSVRVIAATAKELSQLKAALRNDLFFRLAATTITVPPLRDRSEDIPLLAAEFLRELAERYGKAVHSIPAETQRLLSGYSWPGNVRELRNVIEQAVLLSRMSELDPVLLPQMLHRGPGRQEVLKIPIGTAMDQIEREVILRTLEANDGNKTATAEVLGISRRSIYNKLAIYGIDTSGGASAERDERARSTGG